MADIKGKYGSIQTLTCTLTSLANAAARETNTVDNSSDLFLDVLAMVKVKFANTAVGSDRRVYIYAWGIIDASSPEYPDAVTGSDATITLDSPTQLNLVGRIEAAQNVTRKSEPFSIAQAFGGILPVKWGLVILNMSNIALTGTGSDHTVKYHGILSQSP